MDPNKNGLPLNKTGFVRASSLPRTPVWWSEHPTLHREEANLSEKARKEDVSEESPQHNQSEEAECNGRLQ